MRRYFVWFCAAVAFCFAACEEGDGGDDTPFDSPAPQEDGDGDGYPADVDCDDTDPTIHPGIGEICDGVDNNCNGVIDDIATERPFYPDADADGFGALYGAVYQAQCTPIAGYTAQSGDCNDNLASVYPGAPETANALDDDCDGTVDEGTTNYDDDGDGWSEAGGDCDDASIYTYPGKGEWFDRADNDCDGEIDEDIDDGDDDGDFYNEWEKDCDDANPLVATYLLEDPTDGIDNDCDMLIDEVDELP